MDPLDDAIRRRGEDIASFEVETEINSILSFLEQRMSRFMIPRYPQIVDPLLQKTPTGKIQKGRLPEAGTAACWNRAATQDGRAH